jgi:hypothetical protein
LISIAAMPIGPRAAVNSMNSGINGSPMTHWSSA